MTRGEKTIVKNMIKELEQIKEDPINHAWASEADAWIDALEWVLYRLRFDKTCHK